MARLIQAHMARARREEHQAAEIGACRQGRLRRLTAVKAADFHLDAHGPGLSPNFAPPERGRRYLNRAAEATRGFARQKGPDRGPSCVVEGVRSLSRIYSGSILDKGQFKSSEGPT